MSRKKNKFRAENKAPEKSVNEDKKVPIVAGAAQDGMKKEFLGVLSVMIFIIAILVILYYYDQKSTILETMTDQIFNMF